MWVIVGEREEREREQGPSLLPWRSSALRRNGLALVGLCVAHAWLDLLSLSLCLLSFSLSLSHSAGQDLQDAVRSCDAAARVLAAAALCWALWPAAAGCSSGVLSAHVVSQARWDGWLWAPSSRARG